ncbi:2-hydroxyacyl-CoA dehydratase [Acutalibacter muris]|uniref:2-hydroxyacyl-CoA dehydratase n=1 Tax=Acutalibacter muris TaxID=1796620 RepID=A0A1Z2XVK2_9FIRM|nr:2-hydroxyacyl-CoA dehydratase [Acutalibacter muris]ANU54304.1 2-hydroxyglutaryl-CoA dehydratase [Hungateiclostridiaceae bacterium KB18]ASB42477.1 2-hydroxyglutaryl-CoA dehydratase [Acutalibacter muris]MCI9193117.1 2-hydroxyglutaryl-CoA dehydratase [Acutalibacter muris]MCI9544860.1 2-hydroxyglutaryl-CoA dehydratase [Acutalibacter muris]QQR31768.1 2-hydroxyacyl-CoA dehydratase [Acutalibacter muris]
MADNASRVEFTREMKKDYTIITPNMAPIHFELIKDVLVSFGYKIDLLTTTGREIVDEGLKYVHNDTCYPALLSIGQMMHALHSGKYDLHKVALVMTQTGGGCRASNYIHLLRKALKKDGLDYIPVISLNLSGLESNSGFKITLPLLRRAIAALTYGDLLMLLKNQTKPYELTFGESDRLVSEWTKKLTKLFEENRAFTQREVRAYFDEITESFARIPVERRPKTKVGIVGEIYVKYSALANNGLEDFLFHEGCEVMVPGIVGFMIFKVDNRLEDIELYGGSSAKKQLCTMLKWYFTKFERDLIESVKKFPQFTAPAPYSHLKELAGQVIGYGCKMGEGWLLTAEMMELIESGYENVVCTQPFGCLPNHIVGKGMIRKVKKVCPQANIVPIDYDPSATAVNQENRIKLMLAVANT